MSKDSKNKNIRIVHVITGLDAGGAETMLWKLLSEMGDFAFSQTVISLLDGGSLQSKIEKLGVPVYSLGMRQGVPSLAALWHLRKLIDQLKPDLIQGWMYHGNLAASLANFFLRDSKSKVLWNIRASLNEFSNEKLLTQITIRIGARLSGSVSKVIYNSLGSEDGHLSFGYCSRNSIMIPNGFDTKVFKPDDLARGDVRCELGLPDDAFLIGRVGRFHQMKDYSGFLKAANIILQSKPEVYFLLAGRNIDSNNQELLNSIRKIGLKENILLLGERSDIPRLTAALDIAVSSSSDSESFPNVVGEAMSCAVPCVVTDVGDSALIVGGSGRVVPPRNPEMMADAIGKLINEGPAKIHSLGKSSRKLIGNHYSLDKIVNKYLKLYHSTLNKPSKEKCVRIVHVITGLHIGGAEMMLFKLISAMDRDRFAQDVVSLVGGGGLSSQIEDLGVSVYSLNMKSGVPSLLALLRLRKLLRQLKPDIVQGWMYHGNIAALLAGMLCGKNSHKILWNMRASVSSFSHEKWLTAMTIRLGAGLSKKVDKVIYNSFVGRDDHLAIRYSPKNCVVIPNGFDTEKFKPNNFSKKNVRLELGLHEDAFLVGMVGRYHPMKDHMNFLRAAGRVSKNNLKVHFLLVGKNINYKNEELMFLVRLNGLIGRISLLDERSNIHKTTAALDISVLSSAAESFPNVVGEAMSCSIPCVVTDVGDAAQIVGGFGRVVPPEKSELLADAIEGLLNESSEKIHSLGKASRERIVNRYSLKKVVDQYQKLYSEIVS